MCWPLASAPKIKTTVKYVKGYYQFSPFPLLEKPPMNGTIISSTKSAFSRRCVM